MMMGAVEDDEDDFIVRSVEDACAPEAPQGETWGMYGLKNVRKLGGLVFAGATKAHAAAKEAAAEPEPTLPAGFSATLNAEEEKIYPAEMKIKVLVAEGSLAGRRRRRAAEYHQALQQVVGAAAIYNHLLVKHGGVGTRPKSRRGGSGGDQRTAVEKHSKPAAACDCGGATGSCKAISAMLKDEMDKVVAGAESERRGAMLWKLQQVERRSGGLCNPDQLQRVVRSSSTDPAGGTATAGSPDLLAAASPPLPPPAEASPRRSPGSGRYPAQAASAGAKTTNLVLVDVDDDAGDAAAGAALRPSAAPEIASVPQDTPWAEDMLCRATRKRHAAMLKTRGLALAKALARMLEGVSKDLRGVASMLPPWEEVEEDANDESAAQDERESLCRIRSRGSVVDSPGHGRSLSQISAVSVDISEDDNASPERRPSSSDIAATATATPAPAAAPTGHDSAVAGRPPTPGGRVAALAAAAAAVAAAVAVAPVSAVASVAAAAAAPAPSAGGDMTGAADEIKNRRQDWKLDAQELSLIRKEEERVMKPEVVAKLFAKGSTLGCLQQADFWDVFARLEVVTRTEALLNIAIAGGRGCAARSGRLGRELCISLTSVVLEAINAVEEEKRTAAARSIASPRSEPSASPKHLPPSPSPQQKQKQQQQQLRLQQRRDSSDSANPEDEILRLHQQHPPASPGAERRRPSSERLSRGSVAAAAGGRGRWRGLPPARRVVQGERVAGTAGVSRKFYKEDPGLKDLDRREREFRQAIYVHRRSLAMRLRRLTNDAPLCSRVLGKFADDSRKQNATRPLSVGRGTAASAATGFASTTPIGFSMVAEAGAWNRPAFVDGGESAGEACRPSPASTAGAPFDVVPVDASSGGSGDRGGEDPAATVDRVPGDAETAAANCSSSSISSEGGKEEPAAPIGLVPDAAETTSNSTSGKERPAGPAAEELYSGGGDPEPESTSISGGREAQAEGGEVEQQNESTGVPPCVDSSSCAADESQLSPSGSVSSSTTEPLSDRAEESNKAASSASAASASSPSSSSPWTPPPLSSSGGTDKAAAAVAQMDKRQVTEETGEVEVETLMV